MSDNINYLNEPPRTERVAVKFHNPQDFVDFCGRLQHNDILFELAGFQTVVLKSKTFNALDRSLQTFLQQKEGAINIGPMQSGAGKTRRLLSPQEAREKLQEFTAEMQAENSRSTSYAD